MLWKRVLSAGIPLPLVLLLIHFGPTWAWGIFIAFCAGVALYEYLAITRPVGSTAGRWALTAVGVGAFWGFFDLPFAFTVAIVVALFFLCFLLVLSRPGDLSQAFGHAATLFFGFLYVPLLLSFLVRLHALPDGREWVYISLLIAWCGDTAAYFAGRAFGRHKLYPVISPGKTWEGALGGLLGSLVGVLAIRFTLLPDLPLAACFVVAIPGGILGQLGDLCESMLKRGYSVKDSGTIMPGHGGLLDRIDALLFILPYTYACAFLVDFLVL
jgi:phosphatidate cytidylyltransferase